MSPSSIRRTQRVLVFLLGISRRHADKAVSLVIVGVDQVLDDIHPTHGAGVRQICPYLNFDNSIESLHHGSPLIALTGQVLDSVAFHLRLEVRVEEFLAFVNL